MQLAYLPFFHAAGMVADMIRGIFLGHTIVIIPRFEPQMFLGMIQRYKVRASLYLSFHCPVSCWQCKTTNFVIAERDMLIFLMISQANGTYFLCVNLFHFDIYASMIIRFCQIQINDFCSKHP